MSTVYKKALWDIGKEKSNGNDSEEILPWNEFSSWHKRKCRTHLFLILSNIKESFGSVKQGQAWIRKVWNSMRSNCQIECSLERIKSRFMLKKFKLTILK